MALDHAAGRPGVGYDEHANDRGGLVPASLGREPSCEPHLHVEAPERLLEVADRAFHLDHEHHPDQRMHGEDVDPPAIAVSVEAHLDARRPPCGPKERDRVLDDPSVDGIEEPIEFLAAPADAQLRARLEGVKQATDEPKRLRSHLSAFDPRDDLPRDAGSAGEVGLSPAPPTTEGADGAGKVRSEHQPMIVSAAYPPITA